MSEFSFIMVAVMIQHVLAFVRPLSVALQSKQCDLVEAYEECQTLITTVKEERKEVIFNKLFSKASILLRTPMEKIKTQRFLGLQQAKGMLTGQMHQPQLQKSSTGSTITTLLLTMCYHICRAEN